MSSEQVTLLEAVAAHLRSLSALENADVVLDYASTVTHRPVLTPLVSVGLKSMRVRPVSRYRHTLDCVVRLTILSPCGSEQNAALSTLTYDVAASMVGRTFVNMAVESADVSKTAFDVTMYGVGVELDLTLRATFSANDRTDPSHSDDPFTLGNANFDRYPDEITVTRAASANVPVQNAPRRFRLTGRSDTAAGDTLWNALHALASSGGTVTLTLPRTQTGVSVHVESLETQIDCCGYGFTYDIVLTTA